jgi:hypothetical protein
MVVSSIQSEGKFKVKWGGQKLGLMLGGSRVMQAKWIASSLHTLLPTIHSAGWTVQNASLNLPSPKEVAVLQTKPMYRAVFFTKWGEVAPPFHVAHLMTGGQNLKVWRYESTCTHAHVCCARVASSRGALLKGKAKQLRRT